MKEIVVRPERCLGCRSCEIACAVEHSNSKSLFGAVAEKPVPRKRVYIEFVPEYTISVPMVCHHCEDAPCVLVCPTGALRQDEVTGVVTHNPEACIGCWTCASVCNYGMIGRNKEERIAIKCDQCPDLEVPACVAACPTGALEYGESFRDIPREENLLPGTPACAGCGGLLALRHALKALGEKVVIVNAAGCFTLLAIYPLTPFKSSWLYTAMASAPAGAQGVRDALDILMEKGRLDPEEDLKVLVLTGDGSAYDMGLSSTSGAIYRNLDFYYLCYDNEAYGNTGFQKSGATPRGSKTATTPPGSRQPEGSLLPKKDLFEIWRSHRPPYLATVSPAYPIDLINKFRKAEQYRGPKLFISLAPCPTGWGTEPSMSVEVAKLAVQTGVWALKEAIFGEVSHTLVPKKFKPVEEYLACQERFAHLFWPERQEEVLREIQARVDEYWRGWKEQEQ